MPAPYDGGCQCGRARYRITCEPLTLYLCHCRECQKQSAGAFGMSMIVPRAGFMLRQGTLREWRRVAPSGTEVFCHFCGDCGTRLYHCDGAESEHFSVKPGSLDDTGWLRPIGHLWTKRAQPWVPIAADSVCYEADPPDLSKLIARWQQQASDGAR